MERRIRFDVCIAGRVLFVDLWLLLWVVCAFGVCAWLYNGLSLECCVHVMLPYIPLSSLPPPTPPLPSGPVSPILPLNLSRPHTCLCQHHRPPQAAAVPSQPSRLPAKLSARRHAAKTATQEPREVGGGASCHDNYLLYISSHRHTNSINRMKWKYKSVHCAIVMWTSHKVKSWCLCVHVCLVHCACPLRFATNEQGLLLASDVAARGLDIHKVQHVIHYHVPVNSDVRGREGGREGGREEGREGEGEEEERVLWLGVIHSWC